MQESSEHHREYTTYLRHLIQVSKPVLAADSLYPLPSITWRGGLGGLGAESVAEKPNRIVEEKYL